MYTQSQTYAVTLSDGRVLRAADEKQIKEGLKWAFARGLSPVTNEIAQLVAQARKPAPKQSAQTPHHRRSRSRVLAVASARLASVPTSTWKI